MCTEDLFCRDLHLCGPVPLISFPISGENMATDGQVDLSRLEVSLTLANKFEGLEADTDHTSNQSLLLRWVCGSPRAQCPLLPIRWSHSETAIRPSYCPTHPLFC